MTEERKRELIMLADKVLKLAADTIIIRLSFLGKAVSAFRYLPVFSLNGIGTDGDTVYYDPLYVLKAYGTGKVSEGSLITRTLLHGMLHCLFGHNYSYLIPDRKIRDIASDIAVEAAVTELDFPEAQLSTDFPLVEKLSVLRERVGELTADRIYNYITDHPEDMPEIEALYSLVQIDLHDMWKKTENEKRLKDKWKKITELLRTDLKNFSKNRNVGWEFFKNLDRALEKKQDYSDFLRRFMVNGETIKLNDEEFDYVYYEYGLSNYGNMPLIEPLEYKEERRISEFAIVIDTSASCRKDKIAGFIRKTYDILCEKESFFNKINVHIIQCDDRVQCDDRINSLEDMENIISNLKISGFGGTDFRPAFQYINSLVEKGEFENLKGVIYMTDGYGVFPAVRPGYDVAFAFIREDDKYPDVPPWSMGVVL